MSALPERFLHGLGLLLIVASLPNPSVAEEASNHRVGVSKRMSDLILAEFRSDERARVARVEETPTEVDPDVVVLPEMRVIQRGSAEALEPGAVAIPTKAIPLRFGTGITEVRGRRFTALTQKVLFIPLGFRLEW